MNTPAAANFPGKGQFLVYPAENGQVKIAVRLENETVWLTQQHMADLFQTTKQNIGQHLKSIFDDGELAESSVVKNFFTTAADGKDYRTKFNRRRIAEADAAGNDFDQAVKQLPPPPKRKKQGGSK